MFSLRSGISLRLKCHQTLFLVFLLCRNFKKLFYAVKLIKLFFMTSRIVYYVFKDHPHFRVILKKSSHVFLYIFDPSGSYVRVRDQVHNNDFFFKMATQMSQHHLLNNPSFPQIEMLSFPYSQFPYVRKSICGLFCSSKGSVYLCARITLF